MMEILFVKLVLSAIVFFGVLNFAGFHTWVERKQSALIQDRIGANRADILGFRALGLFHGIADFIFFFTSFFFFLLSPFSSSLSSPSDRAVYSPRVTGASLIKLPA